MGDRVPRVMKEWVESESANPLAITVAFLIVGDERLIVIDERMKLLHRLAQLADLALIAFEGGHLQVKENGCQHLQGLKHIAMPQKVEALGNTRRNMALSACESGLLAS